MESTFSISSQKSEPGTRPPIARRRDKPQLSCHACRSRKSKCDRQVPCGTCAKRGLASSCRYPLAQTHRESGISKPTRDGTSDTIRQRLGRLENQIIALMQDPTATLPADNTSLETSTSTSPNAHDMNPEGGNLVTSSAASTYVTSAHWIAILNSISELKESTEVEEDLPSIDLLDDPKIHRNENPVLLFRSRATCSKTDLLAAMPDRPVVDRLVHDYFHDLDLMPHSICIHKGVFLQQYERFWRSPFSVSTIWLGLLYAIMASSAHLGSTATIIGSLPESRASDVPSKYLEQVVQCLNLGDYRRGGPYVIETMLHYFVVEHMTRADTTVDSWLLLGVILRLALRMGYHCDPSHFPNMTPFQCEMRRRIWATLYNIDIMLATQLGVPRMYHDGQWDTRAPLNLPDDDFDEASTELLAPRPGQEEVRTHYSVVRNSMMRVLGTVVDIINTTQHIPAEVLKAEQLAQTTYDSLPDLLKFSPDSDIPTINFKDLLYKWFLATSFYHIKMLLHQRCLVVAHRETDSSYYDHSLSVLLDAALKTLEIQGYLNAERQEGRCLWPLRWRLSSTLLAHAFIMATTVLSKVLFSTIGPNPLVDPAGDLYQRILSVLGHSHEIWLSMAHESREAKQAASLLGSLISALKSQPRSPTTADWNDMIIEFEDLATYLDLSQNHVLPSFFHDYV